ncbi:hypothetical protein D0864_07513 [Hortaea werneckii]|uniref:Protein kinase domain-containing protein n=1 Tax=Hortaea werneckii TaxID=91943 RepID=A0A3M7F7K8_HORWE|nr:hypothetical protein D0864_07513 [Hortaea werneckii]
MIRISSYIRQSLTTRHVFQPRFNSTKASRINVPQAFEEERLPWYRADQFYPGHIGETLISRYKVVGKLGYGAYSTVWLCRDIKASAFVSVKVCTGHGARSIGQDRELKFYEHVASLDSQHLGQAYIRGLLETFEISGPTGKHLCLVHPPMHMTITELQRQVPSKRLNKELLNGTLFNLFSALSFLHDEANVVHAGKSPSKLYINPSNIMLTLDDDSLLPAFEQAEASDPSPRKIIDDTRTIYGSRKLGLPKDALWGQPVLCDFGEVRIGPGPHRDLIQPDLYRAPEVLFEMGWDSSADIWNVGVMIWDLFQGRHLFHALDEDEEVSATHHIAEMMAYIGTPPPLGYLQRSQVTSRVFDEKGQWKNAGGVEIPPPEAMSLERAETVLEGEEKERFLSFVRSMLKWVPEERRRAGELLRDPWLEGAIPY